MCFKCSDNMPLEVINNYLKDKLELPENEKDEHFDHFDTTSVLIILYSCVGMYGNEAKILGIKVLREFVAWMRKNKYILYLPKTGLEAMYHPTLIEQTLDWCETLQEYDIKEDDKDERHKLLEQLFQKFNELNDELRKQNLHYYLVDKYFSEVIFTTKEDNKTNMIRLFLIGSMIGIAAGTVYKSLFAS